MVRRCYLDASYGQIHARVCGQGDPVVLLHLTPGSGAQFDHILPVLADRGFQAWAFDMPGNGRSDPLPQDFSFELGATVIGEAIDAAQLDPVRLVGGHMSAQMAVELVARRPDIATHLVVDGLPMWDRAKRAYIIGLFDNTVPEPHEDGRHVLEAWNRTLRLQRAWQGDLPVNESTEPLLRQALIDSLEAGMDSSIGARAFLEYDVQSRMAELELPVLVTTATGDSLHDQHDETLQAIPHATSHTFKGPHPRHVAGRTNEYVDVLVRFFA